MWQDWFLAPPRAYLYVGLSFIGVYGAIILLTRMTGLRSFSKMSAPDFAMTVAVGSLFASSISSSSPPLPLAVFAMACLFVGQWLFASVRRRWGSASELIDNQPLLLMEGQTFLEGNMRDANVTRADLRAKLREANVLGLDQVRAVIFETTGDISVLHTDDPEKPVAEELLIGVSRG